MLQKSILGVWTLRSFYAENVETKERSQTFGPEPRGTLMFHPDGRMVVLVTPGDEMASRAEADQAGTARTLIAYSGRYRLEPPDRFVTSVDVAWIHDWVGTDQARTYTLDEDKLEIVSAPGRMFREDGTEATFVGVLQWTREVPTGAEEPGRISA